MVQLDTARAGRGRAEAELHSAQDQLSELRTKLLELETAGQDLVLESQTLECGSCQKMARDNAELREVTDKLQAQLGLARAKQLVAQKTELPLLSQKLLDEKNQELEQLR